MTVTEAFLDQFREGDGDTDLVNLSSVAGCAAQQGAGRLNADSITVKPASSTCPSRW
jgi:hypothetical protein